MPGGEVISIDVIEAGLALQAAGCATNELDIHSSSLRAANILVLEVLVARKQDERNQVIDPVAVHTAGELKVLSQSLFHSRLHALNVLGLEFEIAVVKNSEVRVRFHKRLER